jgi:hypothetical protein
MIITDGTSSASRRSLVLSVISVVVLGACADDTSAPRADNPVAVSGRIRDQTGAIREVTGAFDRSALEQVPTDAAADKAGCVHLRFCTTTFVPSDDALCDTHDPACSSNTWFSECNGDARAVCGQNRSIGFDPAIPCPISGVPRSFCGCGESLVWIHFR